MLELIDITKVYKGHKRAVDGLTLRLGPGLVGLLGPNGAGKSSLLRIAATVTRPTGGQVRFAGGDAVARPGPLRRALGYLPQDFGVYPHLTGHEFLSYLAAVRGLAGRSARARVGELLELVNLTHAAKRPSADTPAACCGGSGSRRRSSRTRGSSSWTSRPRVSTRRSGCGSATC
ncbi:hypothetical protein GCM10027610_113670 [Dactylosporangium cerinum]